MTDPFDKLRNTMHDALAQKRQQQTAHEETVKATRFSLFLQVSLENLGISPDEMARRLALDPELAQALLDGELPTAEIDDELLRQIAKLLQHPAPTLGLLLGREISEENQKNQEVRRKP
jgi:hypothetical protein